MNVILNYKGIDPKYKIWHANNENMFLYVHSGSGIIVTDKKNYPICEGVLYFIGANVFHYTLPENPESYERSKIFVSEKHFHKLLSIFQDKKGASPSVLFAQISKEQQKNIELLLEDMGSHSEDEIVLSSICLRLFAYVKDSKEEVLAVRVSEIQAAVDYIHQHISEDIKIEDVCNAVNLSKYYFCRKFKQVTGYTVMDYIVKTRVIIAQDLLKQQTKTITEISSLCGFSSVSYFCRIFKQELGMTPLRYKKSLY